MPTKLSPRARPPTLGGAPGKLYNATAEAELRYETVVRPTKTPVRTKFSEAAVAKTVAVLETGTSTVG